MTRDGTEETGGKGELVKELAEWIDTNTIAELIVEEMEDGELELDLPTAKNIWLSMLEEISSYLRMIVDGILEVQRGMEPK